MTSSDVLDVALLVLVLVQVVAGYREGLLIGLAGLVGLVGGAAVGVAWLPHLVAGWTPGCAARSWWCSGRWCWPCWAVSS